MSSLFFWCKCNALVFFLFKRLLSVHSAYIVHLVQHSAKKPNGCNWKNHSAKVPCNLANGVSTKNKQPTEDVAARRIQKAFRAYIARKRVPRLKGMGRIQGVVDDLAIKNQTSSALSHTFLEQNSSSD